MRVPLSWLREFVDPGLEPGALADLLTVGGLAVESVDCPTGGTRGVVVAEVIDVARIEGTDKLHLVHVSDGTAEHEIVCGASNYGPGDRVPAALPGAVLQGNVQIGRKKFRSGLVSNGMLASPRELGVGDDHAGIWVLDPDAPVGDDLTQWLGLDDVVLELEVTPDRGYGLSMLGVARDVAALTGAELRVPHPVAPTGDPGVPVTIEDADRCRRFDGRTIRGVRVGPSPAWLQRRLAAAGMRPLSNIVDATNHAMLEIGNPIHAYDLALLAGPSIVVRVARLGETLRTLDGVDRALDPDDLLICDADGPIALAGVMGGEHTEINDHTDAVFLEVANFSSRTVLRTARRHQLLTEGSKRWEKTVPPESAPLAATRCVELILATAGGRLVGGRDTYPNPPERPVIRLRMGRTRSTLGVDVGDDRQRELLERIDCEVTGEPSELRVVPPAWRPDLQIEVDLYEEIARLHGYDRIPETVPSSGQVGGRDPGGEATRAVRRSLAAAGWSEALTLPFAPEDDVEALLLPQDDPRRSQISLVNPLSKEESVLRTTLLPGLLRAVRRNVNRQVPDVSLFEVGRAFLPPTDEEPGAPGGPGGVALPAEPLLLAFAACGNFEPPRHDRPGRMADVYDLLGGVTVICRALGIVPPGVTAANDPPYHPGRAARLHRDGQILGVVGELHPRVVATLGLPERTLAGELRLGPLVAGGRRAATAAQPSPLPGVRFDVAVIVETTVPAADVERAVRAGAGENLSACRLFDVFSGSQVGEGNKSLAYALALDDPARQLNDADVTAAIERIEQAVVEQVSGRLRR
ncbi:MAG: phenylalanine--tRNA ligase subunit beta [Nitriliruptorales bacterium]|nr:phenylalanine--tRNA ligase subunit beta [Nitriliruptorales bacterium]